MTAWKNETNQGGFNHIHHRIPKSKDTRAPGNNENKFVMPAPPLQNYDILCGRSRNSFKHVGNRRFRVTIEMNLNAYNAASTKKQKSDLIIEIAASLRDNVGARFLKPKGTNEYIELTEEQIHKKIGHALRDMAVARQQSTSNGSQSSSSFSSDDAPSQEEICNLNSCWPPADERVKPRRPPRVLVEEEGNKFLLVQGEEEHEFRGTKTMSSTSDAAFVPEIIYSSSFLVERIEEMIDLEPLRLSELQQEGHDNWWQPTITSRQCEGVATAGQQFQDHETMTLADLMTEHDVSQLECDGDHEPVPILPASSSGDFLPQLMNNSVDQRLSDYYFDDFVV